MDKDDLKTGDIVTLRNGDRLVFNGDNDEFEDLGITNYNGLCRLCDLNMDMTYDGSDKEDRKNDIVKVERAETYKTIFTREIKKMTVAEICEELGYDVEIIKEDN